MHKDEQSGASSTLTLLISIIQNSLVWHGERLKLFRQSRKHYVDKINEEKQVGNGTYDKSEYDRAVSLLHYYDDMLVAFDLLLDLQVDLETNPFPGQQLCLTQIARSLYPAVRVWRSRGLAAWKRIFEEYDLPGEFRVRFPVKVGETDIDEVELLLLQLVRDDNTIPAPDVPAALNLSPNCKQYRTVKTALIERGWQWKSRRYSSTTQKVVVPPLL
jgi:hypothetical protein